MLPFRKQLRMYGNHRAAQGVIMKRDMDIVREILFAMEKADFTVNRDFKLPKREDLEVNYHIGLMVEARLIEGIDVTAHGDPFSMYIPVRITWAGHDFIDAARSDKAWLKVRKSLAGVGGSVSFAMLKQMLEKAMADILAGL
jgi:hypothetical protein